MNKLFRIVFFFALAASLYSCSSVALTGRKQVLLYPDSEVLSLSQQSYKEFTSTAKMSVNAANIQRLKAISQNLVKAMEDYFTRTGQQSYMQGLKWNVDLVQSEEVNAFALPSGNIVVYEGMMKFVDNDAQLAAVVGHEIAHAIAKHSNERMSRQSITNTVQSTLLTVAQNSGKVTNTQLVVFNTALGLGAQYGITLPFSRKQEYEADRIGLILMAMAGYDIAQAPALWEKMMDNGQKVPEFLSTHPSDANRINNLNKCMEEAASFRK